jgi:hypothetical protein
MNEDDLTQSLADDHARKRLSIVCRYLLAAIVFVTSAITLRCDSEVRVVKAQAAADVNGWEGKARECARWTP